jgi:crotonobetainyl-CoA:carnitine CoA-transferase CaiB-like acyl-CoA transferase
MQGALKGMRILDASQIMAGPFCTMTLADMGAEVIKIEKINGGDDSRQMGPFVNGESTCFFQINRNKKSMALNLKDEQGKGIFYELIKDFDIFVENFRPGVTKSLGIDYETVKKYNPSIIYCSVSGYGQWGPHAHKGGFDLIAQGATGIMSMTGEAGKRPMKTGIAIYDIGAGLTATYSILAAYIHRQHTGEGQHVDISLVECGLPWYSWEAAAYFANGTVPTSTGSRHRVAAPYQAFQTKDKYIMIGGANQRTWEKFCTIVIERPEWMEDPRFIDNTARQNNIDVLEEMIEEIFKTNVMTYWLELCDKAGVPAGPINNFEDAMQDQHYLARGMIKEIDHPTIGKMKTISSPTKFSATPTDIKSPPPLFGEHTNEILMSMGYSHDKVEHLRTSGVVK